MLATYLKGRSEAQFVSPYYDRASASYNIMGYVVLPKSYSMMILYSEMLPFSATDTILSVIPVCSLHVAMLNNSSLTLAFYIIFTQTSGNFYVGTGRVCPDVATPLILSQ